MSTKKRFTTSFALILMLLIVAVGSYQILKINAKNNKIDDVGFKSNNSYYALRGNATEYQVELNDALNDAIEKKDTQRTAQLVGESFIADFFTWTNKIRLNDVGGLQFVRQDIRSNFSHAAQDGIYNDMYTYLSEGKIKDTLEVIDTQSTVKSSRFTIDEEIYDAYQVSVQWTYQESDVMNTAVYQSRAILSLVADEDGLYSIVEVSLNE